MQLFDAQFSRWWVALVRCATSTSVCPRRDLNQASRLQLEHPGRNLFISSAIAFCLMCCALCAASVCSQRHGNNRLQKQKRLWCEMSASDSSFAACLWRDLLELQMPQRTHVTMSERGKGCCSLSHPHICMCRAAHAAAVKYRSVVSATLRLHLFWRYCTFNQL